MWQKDWFSKWALYSPDKVALKEYETNRSITYKEINKSSIATSLLLLEKYNLVKHDRITILADFCLEYCILFGVAQKTGIALVPLNYRLSETEIDEILINADPSLIIVEDKYKHLLPEDNDIQVLDLNDLKSYLNDFNYDHLSFQPENLSIEDPLFILYTSGSTGVPKGVIYSHKMLFWNSINTSISLILNSESRTVVVMPPFHTGGWNVLLTPFLHHGAYACICKKFDPEITLQLVQKERASLFMGVPTMLQMMADQKAFEDASFPDLLYMITGGESMSIPLIEKWNLKDVKIRQGYGLTEVGPNLTSLHQDDSIRKIGSIGRPNFYVETKIVNSSGIECNVNEPGELWLSGPMVTPGYWHDPALTISSFSTDGRWFKTGDLVIKDEENYYFIVDRLKNMYISGGENIYPAEIEKVLLQHPDIKECIVVSSKHEKWGEVGIAYITLYNNKTILETDLINFCSGKIAKFKVPKSFKILDELPKNASGKIDRKALK